ncbi:DUF4123 domain-containing protein [Paraherbaspirillum soli]|uniref:DUF4123 domain-containing protein n=1 Tax=Paraherbaspirillum soli TaxID=631222 RepID=A0ABW0M601_9BURK
MYCAYDRHTVELPAALGSAMDRCLERHPDAYLYALIDSAFAPEEVAALAGTASAAAVAIYADTPLQGFEELSPLLVQFPQDKAQRDALVARWLELCNGKPMLSFIASALDIGHLKQHFSAFLQIRDDSKQRYFLRFADVCTTQDILDCLQPEQKQAWLNGMYAWWIIARNGGLQSLGGTPTAPVAAVPNDWHDQHISDAQLIRLGQKSEADSWLSHLHETRPELFAQHQPSVLYQKTSRLLQQLDQQQVREDRVRLRQVLELLKAQQSGTSGAI